ncbi:hypothetical protein B0J11DRAFT_302598 [Dendryphion nanum]|uniref:Uncharacterized protein n=1 Tax=Dendryphion nanum TaxID=256645 RepID=A0A9P9DRF3_9PLEO|nr:hypothetical protein B0J11DRAFT_302598 [Dendryphion nanum]
MAVRPAGTVTPLLLCFLPKQAKQAVHCTTPSSYHSQLLGPPEAAFRHWEPPRPLSCIRNDLQSLLSTYRFLVSPRIPRNRRPARPSLAATLLAATCASVRCELDPGRGPANTYYCLHNVQRYSRTAPVTRGRSTILDQQRTNARDRCG